MSESVKPPADQWAIVELMGHLRLAGRLTEEERFGAKLGRLDVPAADGTYTTRLFGGNSVYQITFVSEDVARAVAAHTAAPVSSWELPRALAPAPVRAEPDDDRYAGGADDDPVPDL